MRRPYHALPEVVADLLRLAASELADELDLSTLERMPGESVDTRLLTRVSDMVWRVCFRRGRLAGGTRPWLLLLVEFQSTVDRRVAQRVREYTSMLLEELTRNGTVRREGGPPPVLAVVVYNGAEERARQGEEMATLLETRAEEWKAQWLAEGIEKGRAEERALLGRLTELKFGAPTAERLSGLLGGLTAPEELLEVGGWIIECGTGAELLDRVGAQAAARTARGGNGECQGRRDGRGRRQPHRGFHQGG